VTCSILCPLSSTIADPFYKAFRFRQSGLWLPGLFRAELANAKICLIQL
jgi:hypothetical protein